MAKKEKSRTLTTTLPAPILFELELAAKELGTTKKAVLIEAFTTWNKQRKQELLAKSYERMRSETEAFKQYGKST
jgi:hypothetical protein